MKLGEYVLPEQDWGTPEDTMPTAATACFHSGA
jgi:hypothetical protein